MSFKEKAVSWRQEVHIGKTKPRLIKAAILLLCFGVLIGMAWYYSEFSAKDCAILVGICVLTLAIYMIDMPVHPVIRILFALVIPVGCFYTFETLTHQMSTMIELAKRLNIAFYYWLFLFVFQWPSVCQQLLLLVLATILLLCFVQIRLFHGIYILLKQQ